MWHPRWHTAISRMFGLLALVCVANAQAEALPEPIRIGLNADMSSINEGVGRAIERGALLAIEEINRAGGVLDRPLVLRVLDHRRNPARGESNVRAFAQDPTIVAILGGKQTSVISAELETIHALGIPYLIPWAAGTQLITHTFRPSYTFRLSLRDDLASVALVAHAIDRGLTRIGLMLEQTSWGRSNEQALYRAMSDFQLSPTRVEWFNWGQTDFATPIARMREAGCDAIILVGNAPEGIQLLNAMLALPSDARLPIISHWGIVGDGLEQTMGEQLETLDLTVLTSFSFFTPAFAERAEQVAQRYLARFTKAGTLTSIHAAAGTAHAYDLVHLLARAIAQAGTTDRHAVRDALEQIDFHAGLIKDYAPPFTTERHDALDASDLRLGRFSEGVIMPLHGER